MTFTVRAARAGDVEQIASWTRDTFRWGDYVGVALGEWIDDPELHVVVAVGGNGVPVAIVRAQMLSPTESWLDAARVHPDARRIGLGSQLNEACVDWARGRGALVARLAVEDDNIPAHNQVTRLGYRQTSTWVTVEREVDPRFRVSRPERMQVVGKADVDPAWMFWSTSELADVGRGLMSFGWLWRKATVQDLMNAAAEQRLLESPAGWVVIETRSADQIDVVWAATSFNEFPRLIDGILDLAADRQAEVVVFRLPQTGWSGEAIVRAGARLRETHIYAKAL